MKASSQQQSKQIAKPNNDFRNQLLSTLADLVVSKLMLGTLILLGIGLALVVLSYVLSLSRPLPALIDLSRAIGTGVLVTGVVSGLLQILIVRSYNRFVDQNSVFLRDDVTQKLNDVKNNIELQTNALIETVASLEAMNQVGIDRIYAKRQDASMDIERDIQDSTITQIRIIGVSLNDFISGRDRYFNQIWTVIEGYIRGYRSLPKSNSNIDSSSLSIRVLILDPNCYGAHLRSFGENRQPGASRSRLYTDVEGTIKDLFDLQQTAKQKKSETKVDFEFRLYQLPPQWFLLSTDWVSYIEPYYFWASRAADASMPLLRCGDSQNTQLHRGMHDHFELIWDHASITSSGAVEEYNRGVDEGLHQCGLINVFHDHRGARPRLAWLINQAKKHVYIQGISLKSYFDGLKLHAAIKALVERGEVEIKILLLDPESEQARYRSFREYLLNKPPLTFEEFQKRPELHMNSDLFRDTQKSIERIQNMEPHSNFQVRLYDSAPTCFMLLVDDLVLVEQYHYGVVEIGARPAMVSNILGEDTALYEYTHQQSKLYDSRECVHTFELMKDHFDFVFAKCSKECLPSGSVVP